MRLLLFSTDTMGPCDMVLCESDKVVSTISDYMGMGAEGVSDITDDMEYARELVVHFDEFDLIISDDVRAFIAASES